jgi:hypothetical protein
MIKSKQIAEEDLIEKIQAILFTDHALMADNIMELFRQYCICTDCKPIIDPRPSGDDLWDDMWDEK